MDRLAFVSGRSREKDVERRKEVRVSVNLARAAVRQELTAPITAEGDELAVGLAEAQSLAEAERKESDQFLRSLLGPVWSRANQLRWTVFVVLVGPSATAILVTFVPEATSWIAALPFGMPLVWIVRVIGTGAALIGGFTGPFSKLAIHLRRTYILHNLQILAVDPTRAADVGFEVG